MNRDETKEWKELVDIQNHMALSGKQVDILTITGFMNEEQFLKHLEYYRAKHSK